MRRLLIVILAFAGFSAIAQEIEFQSIKYDTLKFGEIMAVQTTIKQIYNEGSCVWLISYPQLSGSEYAKNMDVINKRFIDHARIEDCTADDEKECVDSNPWYPNLSSYWNMVGIINADKGIVTYGVKEGGEIVGYDDCFGDQMIYMYDLASGESLWEKDLIKKDEDAQRLFDNMLVKKLGFEPEHKDFIRTTRQVYIHKNVVHVFYDVHTLKEDREIRLEFSFDELKEIINYEGKFATYYELKP